MKVNLAEISAQLVKRGREAFHDGELEAELLALNPDDENDAFIYENGVGNPEDSDYIAHKNKMRNRIAGVAKRLGYAVSIQWTENGDCVVSLSQK
jgi:hypothetical protein